MKTKKTIKKDVKAKKKGTKNQDIAAKLKKKIRELQAEVSRLKEDVKIDGPVFNNGRFGVRSWPLQGVHLRDSDVERAEGRLQVGSHSPACAGEVRVRDDGRHTGAAQVTTKIITVTAARSLEHAMDKAIEDAEGQCYATPDKPLRVTKVVFKALEAEISYRETSFEYQFEAHYEEV
jgi:vacuolar-type H+-ATPase subunit I/STV1